MVASNQQQKSSLAARYEALGRHREPLLFAGGGFLVGLLVFLAWMAMQPRAAPPPKQTAAAVSGAPAGALPAADEGVLDDITGELRPGPPQDDSMIADETESAPLPPLDDAGNPIDGEPPPPMSEGEALARGVFGPPPEDAPLQLWFLEVERGPGVTELLEIEAATPEQALEIVRDQAGDPRIINGPSSQPLD